MHLSTWRIAWRNLGRNRRRTALALAAIAVGQFFLVGTSSIMRGYADNIRLAITGPMVGHAQVHAPDYREERAMDLYMRDIPDKMPVIRDDPAVMNAAARIFAPVLVAPEMDAYTAVVAGVDVDVESQPYGLLSDMEQKLKDHHVLLGYRLARRIEASVGDEVAVVGQGADGSIANDLYTVQDIIKSPTDIINQSGVVMSLENAQALFVMDGCAHEIVIRTNEAGQAAELVGRLRGKSVFEGLEVLHWHDIVPELVVILDMSDMVAYFVLALVFIVAIAGVANTLMMSTFERMHEFGMLLALGSRPSRIVRMIVVEAVLLGLLGVLAGTLLGFAFVGVTSQTGIDIGAWGGEEIDDLSYEGLNLPLEIVPRLPAYDVFQGLIAVLITSIIAAVWPASIAARLEPMEAMRA